MLNFSPTNCEGNGNSPDVIVDSVSEDDDIDISQFVESVLEEPEEPSPSRCSPPPMVYFPNQSARKSQQVYRSGMQIPILASFVPPPSQPILAIGSGLRPVQSVRSSVPPLCNVYPAKTLIVNNHGHNHQSSHDLPSISWLTNCFHKVKASCATLNFEVKTLEERLKSISTTSDTKKIMSLSNDLQSLLKQTELGYKYLGTTLTSDHQQWAFRTSQRRIALNMTPNQSKDVLVKRQILLPLSSENKTISLRANDRLTLPPNMIISVNGSNHSLSITTMEKKIDENQIEELCAEFDIKPCYVLLERCDDEEGGGGEEEEEVEDSDNDDIEIIEELIAL